MSADSPAKTGGGGGGVGGGGSVSRVQYSDRTMSPACVTPQPVTDKSFIDSVTGFINDVVPTSYTNSHNVSESKEQVQWARFETADINSYPFNGCNEFETLVPPPLLLILGYTNGVQVWSISASGEATELMSWRQGNVRVLRILPTPSSDDCTNTEDQFSSKRPLMALCDTIAPGPHFCSLGFISLRTGDQVNRIQFETPILDVLANKSSVIVTFVERIAIFDACTLEDRMIVKSCFQSPGLYPNPVALGPRWLAYAERQMIQAWRSSGGCEGEGVPSYTATVIHAAKSLGKGLRELGESVASSLTGSSSASVATTSQQSAQASSTGACNMAGVVTVIDLQSSVDQDGSSTFSNSKTVSADAVVAHFVAHSEPVVALSFDPTGLLLLTADKRGHDFHLFRIQAHACGSSQAAVHHLYVLHRGDTTAKVQDISFSWDSRWVAVSTLRGTTHVFPVTPYGGAVGVRTHASPHVVNRLSRFHRSAGLSADGRSNSPVFLNETTPSAVPYSNPRLPPFPHPTVVYPLAQIRQPSQFGPGNISLQTNVRSTTTSRQRLSSASEDAPNLKLCATFAAPRAWLLEPRETRTRNYKYTTDSIFVMACHGSLIQYDLDPRHATNIPREKVCDESTIELAVEAKARWTLVRQIHSQEIQVPLAADNPLLTSTGARHLPNQKSDDEDRWLSQVEIITHAGPHRRLWMGPQFMFKTYNTSNAVPLANTDIEGVEIGIGTGGARPARSNPVNMPHKGVGGTKPLVPVLIESTSASSYEQSPRLLEIHRSNRRGSDSSTGAGDSQLREELADAMIESPGLSIREPGNGMGHVIAQMKPTGFTSSTTMTTTTTTAAASIVKVVNPVGTVITLHSDDEIENHSLVHVDTEYPETIILENCDETLFRPIVSAAVTSIEPNVYENLPTAPPICDITADEPPICVPNTIIPCTVHQCESDNVLDQTSHISKNPFSTIDKKKSKSKTNDNELLKFEQISEHIDFPTLPNATNNKKDVKLKSTRLTTKVFDSPPELKPVISYAKAATALISVVDTDSSDPEILTVLPPSDKKSVNKTKKKKEIVTQPSTSTEQIKTEISSKQDSDENYVEAENCGLQIGEFCTDTKDTKTKLSKKVKNKKLKLPQTLPPPPPPPDADDKIEFLNLEQLEKEIVAIEPPPPPDDFELNKLMDTVGNNNSSQTESDDSCKLGKSEVDSEEIEPLITPTYNDDNTNTINQISKTNKKKSKRKRR